jgi:hypothetical protein
MTGIGMHNKLFLSLLLTMGCSPVMAEWIKVSTSEKSVIYMDSSISQRVGSNVVVWLLRDHTSPQYVGSQPFLSSKDQIEVDCQGKRIRRMYSSDHPQHMGRGASVHSEHGPMSWNNASPGTIVKRIVDIACAHS